MTETIDHPIADDSRNETGSRTKLIASFSVLGRRGKPWLPTLLAGASWRALTNMRTHQEVLQLLKIGPFSDTVQNNPKFAFKYLTEQYLVTGFTVAERAACFLHHYRRLYADLPDRILRQLLHWSIEIYQLSEDESRISVTMGLSRPCDKEGELSLVLQVDNEIVFTIAFTIVPGWVVKSARPEVLLISRLQGTRGCPPEKLKAATKVMCRLRPKNVLFAALEGVAIAFGIDEVVCVCSTKQISYAEEYDSVFKHAYEDFFGELDIGVNDAGLYATSVPMEESPLEGAKRGHKPRIRAQREFKQTVRSACTEYFVRVIAEKKSPAETMATATEAEENDSASRPSARSEQLPEPVLNCDGSALSCS